MQFLWLVSVEQTDKEADRQTDVGLQERTESARQQTEQLMQEHRGRQTDR